MVDVPPNPLARLRRLRDRLAVLEAELAATRAQTEVIVRSLESQRDAVNYVSRHLPLCRPRMRVLFLVHHIEAWDSLDELVREMRVEPDFDVVVASIPRTFPGDVGPSSEERIHQGLTARGVDHIRITMSEDAERLNLVRAFDPDIIFRQSQWDADIPAAFSTANLRFARLCLVPYETVNIVENTPIEGTSNSAVDLGFHRAAWRVFVTEMMKEIADRDGVRSGGQFVATGHPKADRLRAVAPAWPIDRDGCRGRVVWSAHHTIGTGWTDFGVAHLIADDMLAWAQSRPDLDFVLLVHPALPPFLRSPNSPVTEEDARRFLARWESLPNATHLVSADYAPVLRASDLLIVDGLSMLVEYQVMEKPIIHLERPGHRPFNEIGRLVMEGVHTALAFDAARRLAEEFLAGRSDPLAANQRAITRRIFGTEPAVPRILAALREGIAAERFV